MNQVVPLRDGAAMMEQVIIKGDLSQLSAADRGRYYMKVCESVGLNPLTKPFEYITLNGKLTLYALRACTDQLRAIHKVSVVDLTETERDGVFIVTAKMQNGEGRTDMAKGAVTINGLKGDALANAIMKAETKAKRRATLSLCGLGFLDETEVETIPATVKRETLPKKDAKDIYTRQQKEIDEQPSRQALEAWGKENADRIKVLPEDWQDILRLRYQERMLDLQAQEAKADPLELPAALRRKMPNYTDDFQGWLKWLDGKLSALDTQESLEHYWDNTIVPLVEDMLPPDQEQALMTFREHEARVSA